MAITSTADTAHFFTGLLTTAAIAIPTISSLPSALEQSAPDIIRTYTGRAFTAEAGPKTLSATTQGYDLNLNKYTRSTTDYEKIIGEIRSWILLENDWDGEGARQPSEKSIKDAVSFMHLIKESVELPEPMLHANGNVSFYWNDKGFYADLEFLGNGRIAYFIKTKNDDRHKGTLSFNSIEVPAVLSTLIGV